eukprot:TRINITY_DN1630_c0_g1_i1.p3 TRINITY_DN1630_c0_g1~~TRINITY_DN1630_c0_g1_i1.p3  ORF type:complete len:118 (+),score=8.17 TRINITY_DN1630_c0_g1_i1:208-561(+)
MPWLCYEHPLPIDWFGWLGNVRNQPNLSIGNRCSELNRRPTCSTTCRCPGSPSTYIEQKRPGSRYSFTLDNKPFDFDTMDELVRAPVLLLTTPCPGSKHYSKFRVGHVQLGYVNTST